VSGLLADRVAIVTGGTKGIGRGIVERFLADGAHVACLSRSGGSVEAEGRLARGIACDVADEASVQAAFTEVREQHGRVDVLVNNAGIADPAYLHEMTLDQFRTVLDVDLVGPWLCMREALLTMRAAGSGVIVNIASIAGRSGNPRQGNYVAAKAGLVSLTKVAARENAGAGIRVNAVAPGLIETEMTAQIPPDVHDRLLESIPMGRPGLPGEIAQAAVFLASDMSSYVTGATIMVSGGRGI